MIAVTELGFTARLQPLSFELPFGQILHVIGPNGCGKTTLLKLLAAELVPSSQGQVLIQEPCFESQSAESSFATSATGAQSLLRLSVKEQARYRAYLSQQAMANFAIPVYHYLQLSCPMYAPKPACQQAIEDVIHRLSLVDKLNKTVTQLSGGEWQRVRLAGSALQVWPSLNPDARLWLLDEPAAPLDVAHANQCHQLIQFVAEQGVSVIIANHDLNHALQKDHWVLMLKQGKLQAFGPSEQQMSAPVLSSLYDTNVVRITHQDQAYLLYPRLPR